MRGLFTRALTCPLFHAALKPNASGPNFRPRLVQRTESKLTARNVVQLAVLSLTTPRPRQQQTPADVRDWRAFRLLMHLMRWLSKQLVRSPKEGADPRSARSIRKATLQLLTACTTPHRKTYTRPWVCDCADAAIQADSRTRQVESDATNQPRGNRREVTTRTRSGPRPALFVRRGRACVHLGCSLWRSAVTLSSQPSCLTAPPLHSSAPHSDCLPAAACIPRCRLSSPVR